MFLLYGNSTAVALFNFTYPIKIIPHVPIKAIITPNKLTLLIRSFKKTKEYIKTIGVYIAVKGDAIDAKA